ARETAAPPPPPAAPLPLACCRSTRSLPPIRRASSSRRRSSSSSGSQLMRRRICGRIGSRAVNEQAPMLHALDEAPLTRRYLILTAAVMVGAVLDLFDFFLIAFVVPI